MSLKPSKYQFKTIGLIILAKVFENHCLILNHPTFMINRRANSNLIRFYSCLQVDQYHNETIGNNDKLINPDDEDRYCNCNNYSQGSSSSATIDGEKQIDYDGAGTFGDIMSEPLSAAKDENTPLEEKEVTHGLVTSTGGTLQRQYGNKISNLSPLDRIALTSNGNLQRIFSSYYDAPVHVHVDKCERNESSSSVWFRTVNLSVFGKTFCTASSVVTVHSSHCRGLIDSGEVGIGQLFRYLDILPKFTIIDAGRDDSGGLWRKYILQCRELTCNIHEEFSADAWEIKAEDSHSQ